jgi:hypothetical protein
VPTRSTDDWKRLLADPELHWKAGRSAHSLATEWQEAQGFPRSFREGACGSPSSSSPRTGADEVRASPPRTSARA